MNLLVETIINTMGHAQQNKVDNKKDFVLNVLKGLLSEAEFHRYEPLISSIIDLLKSISKNKDVLKALKNNKCFSSCIK